MRIFGLAIKARADGEHLLLAARERAAELLATSRRTGNRLKDVVDVLGDLRLYRCADKRP